MANESRTYEMPAAVAAAIWLALLAIGVFEGLRLGLVDWQFARTIMVCAVLLAAYIGAAVRGTRDAVMQWLGARRSAFVVAVPLAAFIAYALAIGDDWKLTLLGAIYVLAPALLLVLAGASNRLLLAEYLAVLIIWLPVEFRWMYRLFPYAAQLTHTLTILLAVNAGIVAFIFVGRFERIGYSLEWRRGFAATIGINLAAFTLIAIPLGLALGFIHWEPSLARLRSSAIFAVGILVFTAWPEEFLFRGLLQNLLSRSLGSERLGLIAAAVIFGFSHILHAPFPNWKYVILATIAGIFYGRAWMKTKSLVPGTIVHAAVDILWHLLFR